MSCELDVVRGRPCDLPRCAESTNPSLSCVPPRSRSTSNERSVVRGLGLDVHRDFCEVAIAEKAGSVRRVGSRRGCRRWSCSRRAWRRMTSSRWKRRRGPTGSSAVLQRHGIRVVVANTRKLKAITEAKAKTDRLDARTLAKLLMSGPAGSGVDARRADAGAAAADEPARADRARPDARQERGAWGALAQSLRAPAGDRRVRQGRPRVARGARAARR